MTSRLAVVVEESAVGHTIASLRREGVYDDQRHVQGRADGRVAIPVSEPPDETTVEAVLDGADLPDRTVGLEAHLRERGWTDEELDRAPGSWAVIGDVVTVRLPEDCPRPEEVGEALLALQGAETVLERHGIDGPHREPNVSVLAGHGATEVIHREHGTSYALDLETVMFSPGNQAERVRMGEVVDPGERVLDMFAGIGYFTLPMARSGALVTAVERNPTAFGYLVENAPLNGVEAQVTPIRGDCKEVVDWLVEAEEGGFDRVVMGHYDALEYLDRALAVTADNGWVHLHAVVHEASLWDEPVGDAIAIVDDAAVSVSIEARRRVKGHSEGMSHVVLDLRVDG